MTHLDARVVELIGFVAAFCTTAAFVPQLLRVFEAEVGEGDLAGNVSLVLSGGSVVVHLWDLHGLKAGDRIKRCHTGIVGKYSGAEAALRSQGNEEGS